MNYRVLSQEQIKEAQRLKDNNFSKNRIAKYFYNTYGIEVSSTAIFENVYSSREKENRKRYLRVITRRIIKKETPTRCPVCTKCMTKEIKGNTIPLNFQVVDRCITCYLRGINLTFMDLLNLQ